MIGSGTQKGAKRSILDLWDEYRVDREPRQGRVNVDSPLIRKTLAQIDFIKVGVPMLLPTYVVTILVAPVLFPYQPAP